MNFVEVKKEPVSLVQDCQRQIRNVTSLLVNRSSAVWEVLRTKVLRYNFCLERANDLGITLEEFRTKHKI